MLTRNRNVRRLMLVSNCAVVERTFTMCGGKLKAPVMRQNAFELALEEGRFSKPTRKGKKWTILVCIAGENRAADSNLGKTASRYTSFETAIGSLSTTTTTGWTTTGSNVKGSAQARPKNFVVHLSSTTSKGVVSRRRELTWTWTVITAWKERIYYRFS